MRLFAKCQQCLKSAKFAVSEGTTKLCTDHFEEMQRNCQGIDMSPVHLYLDLEDIEVMILIEARAKILEESNTQKQVLAELDELITHKATPIASSSPIAHSITTLKQLSNFTVDSIRQAIDSCLEQSQQWPRDLAQCKISENLRAETPAEALSELSCLGAILNGCTLVHSDLRKAQVTTGIFNDCRLDGSDFSRSSFTHCAFFNTTFTNCNLLRTRFNFGVYRTRYKIYALAYSSALQCIATGGCREQNQSTLSIWKLTGRELKFPHFLTVYSLVFTSCSEYLVSGGAENLVIIWGVHTRQEVRRVVHTEWVLTVAVSPNRNFFVGGSDCEKDNLKIWVFDTGDLARTMTAHAASVRSLAFHNDGEVLLSTGQDMKINLWTFPEMNLLWSTSESSWKTFGMCPAVYLPEPRLVVAGGHLGRVTLVSQDTRRSTHIPHQSNWEIGAIAVSPCGTYLVAGDSLTNRVEAYDLVQQKHILTVGQHRAAVQAIQFIPNNCFVITGSKDKTVRVWPYNLLIEKQLQLVESKRKVVLYLSKSS